MNNAVSPAIACMEYLAPSKQDIPHQTRIISTQLLNQLLANLSDLQSQFRVAHWNVKGIEFHYIHQLFGDIYSETLLDIVDNLAERLVGLGGMALGTTRDNARDTQLKEFIINQFRPVYYLDCLTTNLAFCIKQTRDMSQELDTICDKTTANFLLEIAAKLDHIMYLLESHLQ